MARAVNKDLPERMKPCRRRRAPRCRASEKKEKMTVGHREIEPAVSENS